LSIKTQAAGERHYTKRQSFVPVGDAEGLTGKRKSREAWEQREEA